MNINTPSSMQLPDNPYPGLRPFDADEWTIFFGREKMIDNVIQQLADKQFVFIHGASGCGKSSLIRAGVQAQLENEHALQNLLWKTCAMRPGSSPLWHLAAAIAKALYKEKMELQQVRHIRACLNRSSNAIAEAVAEILLKDNIRLFILVDQFEEIFHYAENGGHDEAEIFIRALTDIYIKKPSNIYLITTMRSEFLGDCSRFHGLPETINATQYLVPRMTEEELFDAITAPASLYNGQIKEKLAKQMIRDADGNSDELPLIQHALRLMWRLAKHTDTERILGLNDYRQDKVENIFRALSHHADDIYNKLTQNDEKFNLVIESVFRSLTDIDSANRAIRRPQKLVDLVAEINMEDQKNAVEKVIKTFSDPECSFLISESGGDSDSPGQIDISHESLIRNWDKIINKQSSDEFGFAKGWLYQEAEDGRIWRTLIDNALVFKKNPEQVLSLAIYEQRQDWWNRRNPNQTWSKRYGNQFELIEKLLASSKKAKEAIRKQNKKVFLISIALCLSLLVLPALGWIGFKAYKIVEQKTKWDMLRIASVARQQAKAGHPDLGILLNLNALELDDEMTPPELVDSLAFSSSISGIMESPQYFSFPKGHLGVVNRITYSKDGRWIASASDDSTVKIWDAANLKHIKTLVAHEGWVHGVDFSKDGKYLASTSADKTIRIWDTKTWQLKQTINAHKGIINSVKFDPTGKYLLSASRDKAVMLHRVLDSKQEWQMTEHSNTVERAVFSADGKHIISASKDNKALVLNSKDGKVLFKINTKQKVAAVGFHPDYPTIDEFATVNSHCELSLWNTKTQTEIKKIVFKFPLQKRITCDLAYHPNGKKIAVTSSMGGIGLWDRETKEKIILTHGSNYSWSVEFSPDGNHLVSGFHDGSIRQWDLSNNTQSMVAMPDVGKISNTKNKSGIWRNGEVYAIADKTDVKLVNAYSGTTLFTLPHKNTVTMVALSNNGQLIATGDIKGNTKIWHYAKKGNPAPFDLSGHTQQITTAAFSHDSSKLVTGSSDKTVRVWDTKNGKIINIRKHNYPIQSVSINHQDNRIVSTDNRNWMRLWNTNSSEELDAYYSKTKIRWASFSKNNNQILISNENGTVQQRRFGTSTPIMAWKPTKHPGQINTLFLNQEANILSSSKKNKIPNDKFHFWDSHTGKQIPMISAKDKVTNVSPTMPNTPFRFSITDNKTEVLIRSATSKNKDNEFNKIIQFSDKPIKSYITNSKGSHLVSMLSDKSIHLWNSKENKIRLIQKAEPIPKARHGFTAMSGDGKRTIVATQDGIITLYNSSSLKGKGIKSFTYNDLTITSLAVNYNGSAFVIADDRKKIHLFNVNSGQQKLLPKGHSGKVYSSLFSPDKRTLATAGSDGSVLLWDLRHPDKEPIRLVNENSRIYSIAFSANGHQLAYGYYRNVCVRNIRNRSNLEQAKCHSGHQNYVYSVSFSPDSKQIVSTGSGNNILVWSYQSETIPSIELKSLENHQNNFQGALFNPNDPTQIAAFYDNSILIWDLISKKVKNTLTNCKLVIRELPVNDNKYKAEVLQQLKDEFEEYPRLCSIGIVRNPGKNNDKLTLVGVDDQGKFKVAELSSTDPLIQELEKRKMNINKITKLATPHLDRSIFTIHSQAITSLVFNSDASAVISTSEDNSIQKWNIRNNTVETLYQHPGAKTLLGINNKGNKVVLGYQDDTTWVVNSHDGKKLYPLRDKIIALAFNNDDTLLVTSDWKGIQLWNAQDGSLIASTSNEIVSALLFSNKDEKIYAGKKDGTIDVINITGKELSTYTLVGGQQFKSLSFENNNQHIYLQVTDDKWLRLNINNGLIDKSVDRINSKTISNCNFDKSNCISWNNHGDLNLSNTAKKSIYTVTHAHKAEIVTAHFIYGNQNTILSASKDGEMILWEINKDQLRQLAYFNVPGNTLNQAVASNDGRFIAATNEKGEFYLYQTPEYHSWDGLKQYAQTVVKGLSLSSEEKKRFHIHEETE